jgi:hypothetical protein
MRSGRDDFRIHVRVVFWYYGRVRNKALIALAALTVIVVAIIAVAVWPEPKEPAYQGKKLTEWAQICVTAEKALGDASFGHTYYEVKTDPELQALRTQADSARNLVIQLGTNSIPWLIKPFKYEIPNWRRKLVLAFARIPGAGACEPLMRAIWGPMPFERRAQAVGVFLVMGEHGKAAAPDLQKILTDPKTSADAKWWAKRCLDGVTPRQ